MKLTLATAALLAPHASAFLGHGAMRPLVQEAAKTRGPAPLGCGFLAICDSTLPKDELRLKTLTLQRLVRHRGPDGSGIHVCETPDTGRHSAVAHERLAIVDPLSGNQPLFSADRSKICTVNGEIYNHLELRASVKDPSVFRTGSDCESIVHVYDEIGVDVASKLDGDFAFVIIDEKSGEVYAARDPAGVNSMYMGRGVDGSLWFASEAKPLVEGGCISIETFPPGHYYKGKNGHGELVRYYNPVWRDVKAATAPLDLGFIRDTFIKSVEKRLMADVPYGVFLSGGLDSSLVASVITRVRRKRFLERGNPSDLSPLKSFSIGLKGSPDLAAARKVADAIGTEHYGFEFTVQEGLDAVSWHERDETPPPP